MSQQDATIAPTPTSSTPRRVGVAKSQSRVRLARQKDLFVAILFLLPATLALLLFRLLPAGYSLVGSFSHNNAFVGLENYLFLLESPLFWGTLKTTLIFNVILNPVQIIVALFLAVLFSQKLPTVTFWRALVFLPVAVPFISSSLVWSVAFRPDGILNAILAVFHIGPQPFLTSPDQALYCIMLLASWIGVGYWMIFLIAGLQEIPTIYREAASIDGAGPLRIFLQIVLPLLRRPLAFVLVSDTAANFILFAPIQALTGGGPDKSTNVLMFDVYRQAFTFGDTGLAYAEVTILTIILLVIVAIQFKLLQSGSEQ